MKKFFSFIIATLVSFNTTANSNALEILSEDTVKTLLLRMQSVLNETENKDHINKFFKFSVDSGTRILITNHLLDPNDVSKDLATEELNMSPEEYVKYIDIIRKPNYKHLFKIEHSNIIIDEKTEVASVSLTIQEYALRKRLGSRGEALEDQTILASTNCNMNIGTNGNDAIITSMNCIGKILEVKPTITEIAPSK